MNTQAPPVPVKPMKSNQVETKVLENPDSKDNLNKKSNEINNRSNGDLDKDLIDAKSIQNSTLKSNVSKNKSHSRSNQMRRKSSMQSKGISKQSNKSSQKRKQSDKNQSNKMKRQREKSDKRNSKGINSNKTKSFSKKKELQTKNKKRAGQSEPEKDSRREAPQQKADPAKQNHPSFFNTSKSGFQNIVLNMENSKEMLSSSSYAKPNSMMRKQFNQNNMFDNVSPQMDSFMPNHPMTPGGQMLLSGPGSPPNPNMVPQNFEDSPTHFCLEHRTISNLVCLTDQKIICSNCALFGVHKGHDYIKLENFKNNCRSKLKNIQNEFAKIRFNRFLREGTKQANFMRQKVEDKKRLMFSALETITDNLIAKIRAQQTQTKNEIDSKFERFEKVIDKWSTMQMRTKHRSDNLDHRLQKLQNATEARQTDFQFLMENLYNSGDQSPISEITELKNDIVKHENTAAAYIEEELEKFDIQHDEAGVGRIIETDSMRLVYDGSLAHSELDFESDTVDAQSDAHNELLQPKALQNLEQGIDLRKSINFDINQVLESNVMRPSNNNGKSGHLEVVRENRKRGTSKLNKCRPKAGLNMLRGALDTSENEDVESRSDSSENSIYQANMSKIQKSAGTLRKSAKQRVGRANVSQLTDISGGLQLDQMKMDDSFSDFNGSSDKIEDNSGELLGELNHGPIRNAFDDDSDQNSFSNHQNSILNTTPRHNQSNHFRAHSKHMLAMQPNADFFEEDQENLYQSNYVEDIDFMHEEPQAEDMRRHLEANQMVSLKGQLPQRSRAPKNSVIKVDKDKLDQLVNQTAKYQLYRPREMRKPQLSKNKKHGSQANIIPKTPKVNYSMTSTGFLPSQTRPSREKRRVKKGFKHTLSMGVDRCLPAKGFFTQRQSRPQGEDWTNNSSSRPTCKKSTNKTQSRTKKLNSYNSTIQQNK